MSSSLCTESLHRRQRFIEKVLLKMITQTINWKVYQAKLAKLRPPFKSLMKNETYNIQTGLYGYSFNHTGNRFKPSLSGITELYTSSIKMLSGLVKLSQVRSNPFPD